MQIIVFGIHRIIEIELTSKEIEDSIKLGVERTRLDEQVLGWTYRHQGKKSEDAHAIGNMGEIAVEKWLHSQGISFEPATKLVKTYGEIKQDIKINDISLGVKTMEVLKFEEAFKYSTYLYPAKLHPGEAFRVLDYPDYLIQVAVSPSMQLAWIVGFVDKDRIMKSPISEIVGKPAHKIPHAEYKDLSNFSQIINIGVSHDRQ